MAQGCSSSNDFVVFIKIVEFAQDVMCIASTDKEIVKDVLTLKFMINMTGEQ